MKDNRLKIKQVIIRDFGSIRDFEGNFSDIVLIEGGVCSEKIDDILYVIRDFMNIGLVIEEGQDLTDDFVAHFNEKFGKRSYIEISFTFDEHPFYYRHFYDCDGKLEMYIRDAWSRFTMRGELLFSFKTYIMNPYAMNIANITTMIGEGNSADDMPSEFNRLWHSIRTYEPIAGINNVLDISKGDYNRIRLDIYNKYIGDIKLTDSMALKLSDDSIRCSVDGKLVDDIDKLSRKDIKVYNFACYILANEVVSRISALENVALGNSPLVLDMELYWDIEDECVLSLIKDYLLVLGRQVFIVEAPNITRALWEDNSIKSATVITDGDEGLQCVTRAMY